MISATDIIRQDLARGGFTHREQQILAGVVQLIELKKARILRFLDTVFVVVERNVGEVSVHFFSVDTPSNLVKAFQLFVDVMRSEGVHKISSEAESPDVVQLIKRMGLRIASIKRDMGKIKFSVVLT